MIVYLTTNLITGKQYIGKDEKNNPTYLGSGTALKQAIKKYGKENFKKEILAYGANKVELMKMEEEFIKNYDAVKSKNFYNIHKGGFGGYCPLQKQNLKKILQYTKDGVFLKVWSSVTEAAKTLTFSRSSISNACINGNSYKNYLWVTSGQIPEWKQKNFNKKKINKVVNGIVVESYESVTALCKNIGINKCTFYRRLACDDNFYYEVEESGFRCTYPRIPKVKQVDKENLLLRNGKKLNNIKREKITVFQYDLDGNLIKQWDDIRSIKEDGEEYILKNIYKCISGTRHTSGGFYWKSKLLTPNEVIKKSHPYFLSMRGRELRNKRKIIIQYLENKEIAIYSSIKEAAKETNIQEANISACARGTRTVAGGYKWKFLNK